MCLLCFGFVACVFSLGFVFNVFACWCFSFRACFVFSRRKAEANVDAGAAADADASPEAERQGARAPERQRRRQLVATEFLTRFVRGFFVFALGFLMLHFCVY